MSDVLSAVARAFTRISSLPLENALKHKARPCDRTPMRLTRPGIGYREGGRCSSVQIRDKRARRPPDVLNRSLKSCDHLRGRGGAWPRLSRIVTTLTSAVAVGAPVRILMTIRMNKGSPDRLRRPPATDHLAGGVRDRLSSHDSAARPTPAPHAGSAVSIRSKRDSTSASSRTKGRSSSRSIRPPSSRANWTSFGSWASFRSTTDCSGRFRHKNQFCASMLPVLRCRIALLRCCSASDCTCRSITMADCHTSGSLESSVNLASCRAFANAATSASENSSQLITRAF